MGIIPVRERPRRRRIVFIPSDGMPDPASVTHVATGGCIVPVSHFGPSQRDPHAEREGEQWRK